MRIIKHIFLIFLFFVPAIAIGQYSSVVERTYLSTDKDNYISGENVGCSVYCFEYANGGLSVSGLSSVAYIELVSSQGVMQQEKVVLVEGRGGAILRLSPDLPTGNYRLVVYTKQNRNEDGYIPYSKVISVYNTLTNTKIEDNVELTDGKTDLLEREEYHKSDLLSVDMVFSENHRKLPVKIFSNTGENLFLNVSVYRKDRLGQLPDSNICEYIQQVKSSEPGKLSGNFIPDFEGEVIQFKSDAFEKKMILSFPSSESNVFISSVDDGGSLDFYTGSIYGEKHAMVQMMPGYADRSHNTQIVSPFIGKFDMSYPKLYLNEDMKDDLLFRGVSMQVNRRFKTDTLTTHLPEREDPLLEIPTKTYLLDDYTRFHTMHEVITEYVTNVRIRTLNGKKTFSILYEDALGNQMFSKFATLVLLDGMPIFNHEDILNYDPMLVKCLRVYARSYRISDITYEGVLYFDTYRGDIPSFPMDTTAAMLSYKGSLYPEYISGEQFGDSVDVPDYRNTLYWHPLVTLHSGEVFEFDCTMPKYPGTFEMVVEGVTESGKPVYYKNIFEMK